MDVAQVWRDAIHSTEIQFRFDATEPWISKVEAPIRFHHHIIGAIQTAAVVPIRHHRDAAVRVLAGDTPGEVFARHEAPLPISRQTIGLVGRFLPQRHPCFWRPLHAPIIADIAEDEIAPFLPPHWSFSRTARPTETTG